MNILIVDDEPNIRKTMATLLAVDGHQVSQAENSNKAMQLARSKAFDVAFVDLRLGSESGLDLIAPLLDDSPWMKIVMITAYGSIDSAVEAIRRGARDYLTKPFVPQQLVLLVQRLSEWRDMEVRLATLEENLDAVAPALEFDSTAPTVKRTLEMAKQAANSDAAVLITGESGVGKTELARAMHGWSRRAKRPFCVVSCPTLAGELLESTLFGHARGAFTGATRDQPGRIATCEGGVLLLDEIGELPLTIQPKLLRFLQEKSYERVGDPVTRKADVRIIAATNVSLEQAVRERKFREDLYFRLNVIQIPMPPLRERPEDIQRLANKMLLSLSRNENKHYQGFTPQALALLKGYAWPGNLRELRNTIERAVILGRGEWIDSPDLPDSIASRPSQPRPGDLVSLETIEELHIRGVIANTTSVQEAATVLGIDQTTLWRRRKQYGL
ncbi:MAG: sigma-54-dependent Fis family transcriptional regulator [Magnetococcales bacterium]|nr:sigma-54-dependent Fis family transcriptional regulator [Magnetococcales bacterium]NGZ26133.1 sigma-54-dependent Fis family transcriptional regulator [Magnetococcales bacterium]